jgi:ubiquitin-protein ligase
MLVSLGLHRDQLYSAVLRLGLTANKGGAFDLFLVLPPQYPFRPPVLTFTTRIYHPNISTGPSGSTAPSSGVSTPTDTGVMCLGMLKPEEWKPPTKIVAVLEFARQLLREPNPDDAVEGNIAEHLRSDRPGWEKQAREWTKKYAIKE